MSWQPATISIPAQGGSVVLHLDWSISRAGGEGTVILYVAFEWHRYLLLCFAISPTPRFPVLTHRVFLEFAFRGRDLITGRDFAIKVLNIGGPNNDVCLIGDVNSRLLPYSHVQQRMSSNDAKAILNVPSALITFFGPSVAVRSSHFFLYNETSPDPGFHTQVVSPWVGLNLNDLMSSQSKQNPNFLMRKNDRTNLAFRVGVTVAKGLSLLHEAGLVWRCVQFWIRFPHTGAPHFTIVSCHCRDGKLSNLCLQKDGTLHLGTLFPLSGLFPSH